MAPSPRLPAPTKHALPPTPASHPSSAAWNAANNCTDEIVGYSPWYGVQGESKPMRVQNHTLEWRQFGAITKINMYYSWNFNCLQGIKVTYGYKAGNARMIGHQKKLYTTHLKLAAWENINRVDLRQVRGGSKHVMSRVEPRGDREELNC